MDIASFEIPLGFSNSPLWAGLDPEAQSDLISLCVPLSLRGGCILFREGDPADALYILAAGALGISVRNDEGHQRKIARVLPPETVGEMALLSDGPRSATAVALRDVLLLKLTREAFDSFVARWPAALTYLARLLSERLRLSTHAGAVVHAPSTLALIAVTEGVSAPDFSRALAREMERIRGPHIALVEAAPPDADEGWYHRLESASDATLYVASGRNPEWAELIYRRADHVLLLAKPGEAIVSARPGLDVSVGEWRRCDVVCIQDANAARPLPSHSSLADLAVDLRVQVRDGEARSFARLARIVLGRAFGLVLSGGGARGFAHIGVLQALQEQGYSVDMVSGTSIGAVIAAGCASDWSIEEIRRRIFDAFVVGSPFTDYTIPIVALLRGRKIDACLAEQFGDISIEDLWLPFFCVSSNLTTGRTKLHTSGPLWRALRASVAVPGLLPPVIDPEGVLVDGAVTNNLPADAMADLQRGSVVAVDVARDAALVTPTESRLTAVMRRVLAVPPDMPTIVNVLFRAATVPGEAQTMLARSRADAILRPPLAAVDLRAWHQFDAIAQIGYDYTAGAVREGALAGIAV